MFEQGSALSDPSRPSRPSRPSDLENRRGAVWRAPAGDAEGFAGASHGRPVREAWMSILGDELAGARVLDLFAGAGPWDWRRCRGVRSQ